MPLEHKQNTQVVEALEDSLMKSTYKVEESTYLPCPRNIMLLNMNRALPWILVDQRLLVLFSNSWKSQKRTIIHSMRLSRRISVPKKLQSCRLFHAKPPLLHEKRLKSILHRARFRSFPRKAPIGLTYEEPAMETIWSSSITA